MEFKFRSVDDRSFPSYPIFNNLSELPSLSLSQVNSFPLIPHYSDTLSLGGGIDNGLIPTPMWNPNNTRELVMREHLRGMIREEILITSEIARRREIELEVRKEFMCFEREMAARRSSLFSYDTRFGAIPHAHGPHPPLHLFDDRLEPMRWSSGHVPMPMPISMPMPSHSFEDRAVRDPLPVALPPRGAATSELNASPKPNKDKLIVLAKPNPNVEWTERKLVEPSYPFGMKKKPEDEWSCALCQVSAPNEKALNDHLRGKKHLAKEERLKNQVLKKPIISSYVPKQNKGDSSDSKLMAKLTGIESNKDEKATEYPSSKADLLPEKDELALSEVSNKKKKKEKEKGKDIVSKPTRNVKLL